MTRPIDPVLENDLNAYVDDQLDAWRRIEVQEYLSRDAVAAARVMADLQTRDELRLAFAAPSADASQASVAAAHRLERALSRRRGLVRLGSVAAMVGFIAAGWLAHAYFNVAPNAGLNIAQAPPDFVEDAVMSYRTGQLRAAMNSQLEVTNYDTAEIRSRLAIAMPQLPGNWRVRDVQVFPSTRGPSVAVIVDAGDLGTLCLFAVRSGTPTVIKNAFAHEDNEDVAYWQTGGVAYALTGDADGAELGRAANRISKLLFQDQRKAG